MNTIQIIDIRKLLDGYTSHLIHKVTYDESGDCFTLYRLLVKTFIFSDRWWNDHTFNLECMMFGIKHTIERN